MRDVKNLRGIFAEGRSFKSAVKKLRLKGCRMAATKHTVYMDTRTRVSSFTLPRSRAYNLLIRETHLE